MRLLWKLLRLLVLILLVGLAVYFGSPLLLAAAGRYLVTSHPPQKSEMAVVLAGQPFLRVPEAARLYHDGLAATILLTSATKPPGLDELRRIGIRYPDEQEIALGILDGLRVPRSAIQVVAERADSTRDEAEAVARFLKSHPARTLILVTSRSHTTRSYKIFRDGLGHEIGVTAHAVPADPFDPDRWWKTRGHCRQVVREYLGLADYWRGRAWQAVKGWIGVPAAGSVRVAAREG